MKKLFTLLCFFVFASRAFAQLPAGSPAPDFTATDINGNTWHLNELLDQGITVIIDFSATWCGPCWSYHNTHALGDVYDALGPNSGNNKVMVIFIEGDPQTTMADLQGTGASTQGNWIEGTNYPIIDENGSIGDAYQIGYFPTLYRICPTDRKAYEFEPADAQTIISDILVETCSPVTQTLDAAISTSVQTIQACAGDEIQLTTTLRNFGSDNLTSASFKIFRGNTLLTTTPISWTGNLSTYESTEVDLGYLLAEPGTLRVELTLANDGVTANNDYEIEVAESDLSTTKTMKLTLKTDNYGFETYWEMRDASGLVIYKGGNEAVGPNGGGGTYTNNANGTGAYGNNATVNVNMNVPENGCYELVMVDDYGDGMCCAYGNGYFRLSDANNAVILEGGQYAGYANKKVTVDESVANNEIEGLKELVIYPNPVVDNLTVQFSLLEKMPLSVKIYNALGQEIINRMDENSPSGLHMLNINTSNLTTGVYFMTISNGAEQMTTRFNVEK